MVRGRGSLRKGRDSLFESSKFETSERALREIKSNRRGMQMASFVRATCTFRPRNDNIHVAPPAPDELLDEPGDFSRGGGAGLPREVEVLPVHRRGKLIESRNSPLLAGTIRGPTKESQFFHFTRVAQQVN